MKHYKHIDNKQEYLNENYPLSKVPKLNDKKLCIHCEQIIKVGDYKVLIEWNDEELIVCPNYPKCEGTVLDWFSIKK
jgi:ssDNA-binding Zn-finger/Zn-ribbon topoisomerase 1